MTTDTDLIERVAEPQPTDRQRLLVVDDDADVRDFLRLAMEGQGFDVELAADGPSALEVLSRTSVDLVLLDLVIPGMDGLEVCRRIRLQSSVPIIMVTARRNEADIVVGLEAGADDYVTKPFSVHELTARVRSNLRRTELDAQASARGLPRQVFDGGRLVIDAARQQVEVDGHAIPLSRTEFNLLQFLAAHAGQVVGHDAIMEYLWHETGPAEESRLRTFMGLLRRKLGDRGRSGRYLHSHHGSGYRFDPPR